MVEASPRTIKIAAPPVDVLFDQLSNSWVGLDNGWVNVARPLSTPAIGWEGRLDLAGLTVQEKTFFPAAQTIQEPGSYFGIFTAGSDGLLEVIEIVSSIPLDLEQMYDQIFPLPGGEDSVPSFPGTQAEFEAVIIGRYRALAVNTTFGSTTVWNTIKSESFGSGEPTASETLYTYILVSPGVVLTDGDRMTIPPRRFVLGGVVMEEPPLEYINRLRRSYILANNP